MRHIKCRLCSCEIINSSVGILDIADFCEMKVLANPYLKSGLIKIHPVQNFFNIFVGSGIR